jgi:hypothetical protein
MFLKDADANHDGRTTHAEIDASIRADFDKADANHDGSLDQKEFVNGAPKPPEGARGRPPHDPAAMFGRLDWNNDGKLSPDEFSLPRRAMALHADRNGDGVISEADRPDFEKGGLPPR